MAFYRTSWSLVCFVLTTLLVALANAQGPSIPIAYCASVNTSPNAANLSDFQTEGLCSDFCRGKYSYAVVQYKSCWCSNNAPDSGDQVDTSKCNKECPGYPSDLCGADKLFGYLSLGKVSSTGGNSQSTSGPVKSSVTKTVQSTASDSLTSHSSTLETSSSSSMTPTPSVQTVTAGGTVRTVTITPTSTATDAANNAGLSATSNGGLSTGAAVGIAVGIIAVVGTAVGILIWMWCRKRKRNAEAGAFDSNSQRASSSGMTGTPKTGAAMSENRYMTGSDGQTVAESWDGSTQNGKRRSMLMPVDPRLDPYARGMYNGQNKSRESFNSLQDNQDYSRRVHEPARVLRATNPDPNVD